MNNQAIVSSALVALGVATGSLLAPQAASALDFNFSFGGVTGLIQNLIDNQINACDGTDACVVSVSAGAPTGVYSPRSPGPGFVTGFSVINGQINYGGIGVNSAWVGSSPDSLSYISFFSFGFGNNQGFVGDYDFASPGCQSGCLSNTNNYGVSFTPATSSQSVPGPLPLFGAAAAFGLSRKLRNRIKVTRTTAPTRPAG
jgi:hypothetical protein